MPNIKTIIERINNKPFNANIKFSELVAYYKYYGFRLVRINSSHVIFKNSTNESAIVPTHNNKVLPCYVKQAHDLIKSMEDK